MIRKTDAKILLRPIQKDDFEALYHIDQSCFPAGVAYSRQELRWFLSRRNHFGFVAELKEAEPGASIQKKIVGFILASAEPCRQAHLITLDVLEDYRRQALGRQLMKEAEKVFRKAAVKIISLEVAVENTVAQAFYKKFDYQMMGRIPSYYSNGQDAYALVKILVAS